MSQQHRNINKPSVVVTQHNEIEGSVGDDIEEELYEEEESEGDDGASFMGIDDTCSQISDMDTATTTFGGERRDDTSNSAMADAQEDTQSAKDDVPDLSYDDVASIRSENLSHSESISSLLMLSTNSKEGLAAPFADDLCSPTDTDASSLLPTSLINSKNQPFHPGLPIIA